MSNTLSVDRPVALFDLDAHHQKASRAAAALALAVSAEEDAQTRAAASAEHLEEVEENAGGTTTATELIEARAQVELDAAALRAASFRRRSAERTMPNTDTELADAVAKAVRPLVHHSVPVLSLPADLPQEPELSDYRPLVTVVQSEPCHRSPRGWLSTVARVGAMELEGRPTRLKPILVTIYSAEGLELSLTAAALHEAPGFGLDAHQPTMIRTTRTTYTTSAGEKIVKTTHELDVTGASGEVPLVTVDPEPVIVGHEVVSTIKDGFRRAGDSSPHVDLGSVSDLGTSWAGSVAETRHSVTLTYGSRVGANGEQQAWVDRWMSGLTSTMVDGHGRVLSARVKHGGRAVREGALYGAQGVVVEVATRSRRA